MASIGEFGAARAEVRRATEPDTFVFYGETFTVADEVGTMPLLEFAAAAVETDESDMRGLAAMHSLLKDCLADGEWERFAACARKNKADATTLLKVCVRVYEVVSGRPTEAPFASADGRSTTSQPSSPQSSLRAELGLVPVTEALAG